LIVATPVFDELQLAELDTFRVLESLYRAVAVNCWLPPIGIEGVVGETFKPTREGATTIRLVLPLTAPDVAVMVVVPWLTLVALPPAVTGATAGIKDVQATECVRSAVLLSV
jgi:hypothetical protein